MLRWIFNNDATCVKKSELRCSGEKYYYYFFISVYCKYINQNVLSKYHLIFQATKSPHYESDEKIAEIMDIYHKNSKFVHRKI